MFSSIHNKLSFKKSRALTNTKSILNTPTSRILEALYLCFERSSSMFNSNFYLQTDMTDSSMFNIKLY